MFSGLVSSLGEHNGVISDRNENRTRVTINRNYNKTVVGRFFFSLLSWDALLCVEKILWLVLLTTLFQKPIGLCEKFIVIKMKSSPFFLVPLKVFFFFFFFFFNFHFKAACIFFLLLSSRVFLIVIILSLRLFSSSGYFFFFSSVHIHSNFSISNSSPLFSRCKSWPWSSVRQPIGI